MSWPQAAPHSSSPSGFSIGEPASRTLQPGRINTGEAQPVAPAERHHSENCILSEPQKDPGNETSFAEKYRKDKRREGLFNAGLGILFIVWTIFDIVFAYFEDMWYFNIFFGLFGVGLLIYGVVQLKSHRNDQK